ncbi:MAG: hypothetical protein HQL69_05915 [Magnetococcales bacterium]|nr:hypothetical protein [Magnetococcales bacterium]
MATVAFRVQSKDLPKSWAEKVGANPDTEVEVTLCTDNQQGLDLNKEIQAKGLNLKNNPAIGMWAGRKDMQDTSEYLRNLRQPRKFTNLD